MMRRRLAQILGIAVLMSQPIQERVEELISGVKNEIAIKLFGDGLDLLREKAKRSPGSWAPSRKSVTSKSSSRPGNPI